jgi:preprotein translocase subunit SecD
MNFLVKALITILGTAIVSTTIASGTTTSAESTTKRHASMVFQVVQTQMVFDRSTVESATIISPEPADEKQATGVYAVQLKLKTNAAEKFGLLTEKNIGKRMNIIFKNSVISSPIIQSKIGAELLVTGLTKEQASQFVGSLVLPK